VIGRVTFPAPENSVVVVTYPFIFVPQELVGPSLLPSVSTARFWSPFSGRGTGSTLGRGGWPWRAHASCPS
jgi:hypothetical protein